MDIMAFWVSEHIAHKVEAHTHDFYQLIFCKTAGGFITVGNKQYVAQASHAYLAKPGVLHGIENNGNMYILELKFIAEGTSAAALHDLPDNWDISEMPFAQELLCATVSEGLSRDLYCNDAVNAALKLFLIHSIRKAANSQPIRRSYSHSAVLDMQEYENTHNDVRILNLKYYIANHLHENITLADLANEVNFNKNFFVKRFQLLFDMTPMKYVNFMRICRAKQLLTQTALPISIIAEKTGFSSPHYFSRSFRASEDMPPNSSGNNTGSAPENISAKAAGVVPGGFYGYL